MYENEQNSGFWEELRSSVRVLMFLPFAPELDRITGGELIRPYEINNIFKQQGVACRVVVYGREHGAFEPIFRGGRFGRLLLGRGRAKAIMLDELDAARREGVQAWLYVKTPPEIVERGSCMFLGDPFGGLLDFWQDHGGRIWANMHDLAPDHTLGIINRQNNMLNAARHRQLQARASLEEKKQQEIVACADLITVVSYGMADLLLQRYHPLGAISVWNAGVNPVLLEDVTPWQCPKSGHTVNLAYFGSGNDACLDQLADEFRQQKGTRFRLLLGGRDTVKASHLFDQICSVDLLPNPGYKGFASVANQVDLWLVPRGDDPYLDLSWQLKLPMCLASGRPLLASKTSETSRHEESCFMYIWQSGELVSCVAKVLANPGLAERQGAEARRRVLANATWEQQLARALQPMLASV